MLSWKNLVDTYGVAEVQRLAQEYFGAARATPAAPPHPIWDETFGTGPAPPGGATKEMLEAAMEQMYKYGGSPEIVGTFKKP